MVDQATAKYLNDNIGAVLAKALSEMAVQQPNDGVDFIAQWLKTYVEQEETKTLQAQEAKQLAEDRAVMQKKAEEQAKRTEEKETAKTAVKDAYRGLLAKFNDPDTRFQDSFWKDLVDAAKQYMGAQSVYLGLLDEEGLVGAEPPLIRYLEENIPAQVAPTLLDKVLPKMNGETENLTFGALTESVPDEELQQRFLWKPPMPPLPEPGPDGEEPVAPPGPKYLPVSVPCVTDVPAINYFEMPRLGAYLATPLVYTSYYNTTAYDEAKAFEEKKAEEARLKAEKEAEKAKAIAEAEEKGEAPPEFEEEEAPPEQVMELTGKPVKMVLCMDTLGQNQLLPEAKFADMMELCNACAECKARTETKQIDEQALYTIEQLKEQVPDEQGETALARIRADVDAAFKEEGAMEADMKALAESVTDSTIRAPLEECLQKKYLFLKAKAVLKRDMCGESLLSFMNASFAVKDEVMNTIVAIAFLCGYTKEEIYPPRKDALAWWKIKTLFELSEKGDCAFFAYVDGCDLEVGRKNLTAEQKLAFIQGLAKDVLPPADFTAEKAAEMGIGPVYEVLWTFLSCAVDYRLAVLKQKQAEYDQRKKDAEAEEGATFDEPDLTTLDDDFEALLATA